VSESPQGWVQTTVGDVAASLVDGPFGSNLKTEHYTADGVRVIRLQNIGDGRFDDSDKAFISEDRYQLLRRHDARQGDVLIAALGEVLPRVCMVPPKLGPAIVKADCFRLRPSDAVDAKYLVYAMQSPQMRAMATPYIAGIGRPRLNLRKVRNLPIPVAPLAEQKRIVAAIDEAFLRIDAGVAELEHTQLNVKRLRSAALRQKLMHPDAPQTSINEVATAIQYGYTAKATTLPVGPKMLRITDIQEGSVDWENVPNCVIDFKDFPRFRLASGDLVFARTGATVGKSFLITEVPEAVFASYLIRLRFPERILPAYIALFFQSTDYWRQVAGGSLGIGQPNVNATTLGRITLRLPTTEEQTSTVLAMEEIDTELARTTATLAREAQRAQSMRSSILVAAFSGKLVPQDSNDEPASILLERIAAESTVSSGRRSERARRPRAQQGKAQA